MPTPTIASGGNGGSANNNKDNVPSPLSAGDNTASSTTASAAATTATLKSSEQAEKKKRGSHRPARGEDSASSSPSVPSVTPKTEVTSAAATAANERQRGWDASGGLGEGVRGGGEGTRGEETPVEVVNVKQAVADDAVITPRTAEPSGRDGEHIKAEGVAGTAQPSEAGGVVATTPVGTGSSRSNGEDIARAENSPVYGRWPATLDAQWAEVEFMLCHEVDCEESLQYTIEATEAGLVFMDKLEQKAQVRQLSLRGLLDVTKLRASQVQRRQQLLMLPHLRVVQNARAARFCTRTTW